MCSLGVRNAVPREGGLCTNLDPVRVELFEGNGVEVVVLLGVV